MGNWKNKIPKHFFFLLKKSPLIRVIRKNKNSPNKSKEREREREREYSQFLCGKNMDWMGEMISYLFKIKWEEE